jgi:hypothetical protein
VAWLDAGRVAGLDLHDSAARRMELSQAGHASLAGGFCPVLASLGGGAARPSGRRADGRWERRFGRGGSPCRAAPELLQVAAAPAMKPQARRPWPRRFFPASLRPGRAIGGPLGPGQVHPSPVARPRRRRVAIVSPSVVLASCLSDPSFVDPSSPLYFYVCPVSVNVGGVVFPGVGEVLSSSARFVSSFPR